MLGKEDFDLIEALARRGVSVARHAILPVRRHSVLRLSVLRISAPDILV